MGVLLTMVFDGVLEFVDVASQFIHEFLGHFGGGLGDF